MFPLGTRVTGCDLVTVLAGYIPKAQPRRLAAGRWD